MFASNSNLNFMKKAVLFFSIFTVIFTSCNSDDDGSSQQDPIIGTWKYHKTFVNGMEQILTDCEKQETFIFMSNNTVEYEYYEEDESDNCLLEENASGTWSNNGNNEYALDFGFGPTSRTLTFENNTFYYDDVFEDFTFRDVYIRN